MTDKDIERLRELAEAATPGPWGRGLLEPEKVRGVDGRLVAMTDEVAEMASPSEQQEADATFIAAANPVAVVALLDELAKARKQVADMRRLGSRLANAAYNLKQMEWLPPAVRESLEEGQKAWDTYVNLMDVEKSDAD